MHRWGPYNNVVDKKVSQFIGSPLLLFSSVQKGESVVNATTVSGCPPDHQESWSPTSCENNKNNTLFDKYLDFVTEPLPSAFDCEYLEKQMVDYHDKVVLDYIKFGFPLGNTQWSQIISNTSENHASAKAYNDEVSAFIQDELAFDALLGPFDQKPHLLFTWSPLMTRPKGSGQRIILDLSYGEGSVNKATDRDLFDRKPFKLKLPSLDGLLPILEELGADAHLWKIDISQAFRNVRIDSQDAIHLGIMWQNQYYIDKNLAFVHGTAIFEHITNFICFILAKQDIKTFNYIDDIYTCCHKDVAQRAFEALTMVIEQVGLPINPAKVFPPTTNLPIMGIVIDVNAHTFSIPAEKLHEIWCQCNKMFLRDRLTKRQLQTPLGKLLYFTLCQRCSCVSQSPVSSPKKTSNLC